MVTKEDIVRLRKASGQPIMDCKKALQETNSFDEAFEYIRKTATEKIDERRKDRVASEGRVIIKGTNEPPVCGSKIAMVSLLCETDFTAKSEAFVKALDKIAHIYLHGDIEKIDDVINEIKAQTGEKIVLGQTCITLVLDNMSISYYVHFDNKKAALVQFEASTTSDALHKLGKDISMHIVASKPQFLNEKEIDWSKVDLEIPESLLSKPISIIEKISAGKKEKFKKERVLLSQPYCLDDKITVEQAIKNINQNEIKLTQFKHVEIGD